MNLLSTAQEKLSGQISNEEKDGIHHYIRIRKILGYLGILFAGIVAGYNYLYGCNHLQGSISAYYYTNSIALFCGFLFSIGFFLITYKGFYKIENWATNLAGIAAILIALCPTTIEYERSFCRTAIESSSCTVGCVHYAAAVFLFLTLAFISFFVFTLPSFNEKGQEKHQTDEKKFRNKIYRTCGVIILLSLILVFLIHYFPQLDFFPSFLPYLFSLETVCLAAFGFSWLVKGEALFSDNSKSAGIAKKMNLI
jgi:FtsH-binding integral membrane protein